MYMYPTANCSKEKIGAMFIINVYLTASANAVPDARSHSLTSSSPGFHRHHDLLHQSVPSILSVWRVSTVYQSPCLCSVGFLN